MSFIVKPVVSSVIPVLIGKLTSSDLLQFVGEGEIRADLEKWKKTLVGIQDVLDHAEEKQMTELSVKIWLRDLQNLAYDVEDILDEFAAEALQRQSVKKPSGEADDETVCEDMVSDGHDRDEASTCKLIEFIQFCCPKPIESCFTSLGQYSLKINSNMASQIKEITTRFEGIVEQKNSLGLIKKAIAESKRNKDERPSTSHLHEPHIYGRETDVEAVLEWLLKDDGADVIFSAMSIEGMGGLGKTTLAQLAFNHEKVNTHFDIKGWLCVPEDFDVVRITKSILESVDGGTNSVDNLSILHDQLKKKLSEKKFLIVLDDVWNANYDDWTRICLPFGAGSRRSKILITTRDHRVSSEVRALSYALKKLEDSHCLSILTRHSMLQTKKLEDIHCLSILTRQNFQQIAKEMAERCKGVPLAAKTLGGLLYNKDWKEVLDSNVWTLLEDKSGLVPALNVSYYYLPSPLKRCFAYCSLFSKGHVFVKNELILLWMAEGFLQTETGEKEPEDLGKEYFDELHSRSFFQQLSNRELFVMHDLINDLARWAAKDFYFRMQNLPESETLSKMKLTQSLRTFVTNFRLHGTYYDFPGTLLQQQRLRVLSLKGCPISVLPSSISNLKLLHHLDLSYSMIEFLPDSINKIHSLEVLILDPCSRLRRLCSDVRNLIKLRHVYISAEWLEAMPLGIGQLTTLRTLTQFVVGKDTTSGLGGLKDLKDLRERLHIWGLENVNDPEDAVRADLNGKTGLKDLQLQWTDRCAEEISTQVLDNLRPCQKLESLGIEGYRGTRFPNWLGDNSLSSLKCLTIRKCIKCASFPSIGQLTSLEILRIEYVYGIESLGPEFYGHGSTPFLSLMELHVMFLPDLIEWVPCAQAFTRLRQLHIICCGRLEGNLPDHLPSLESLSIKDCPNLTVSLPILPEHCTLEIVRCHEIEPRSFEDCRALSSMVHIFSDISSHILLAERSSEVEKLDVAVYDKNQPSLRIIFNSKSVRSMILDTIRDVSHFLNEEIEEEQQQQQELPRVQYLILKNCKYPEKLGEALQRLTFLRGLFISESPDLFSFPGADLPSKLRFIVINKCRALQTLPKAWIHSISNTSLDNLFILNCDSLKHIATVQLKLKRLKIKQCRNLRTVFDGEEVSGTCSKSNPCLEYLKIEDCKSLTSLCSHNDLPDTIQEISLQGCLGLVSLASRGNLPKELRYLHISSCSELASIAESFHENAKLERLYISGSHRVDNLPSGVGNLNSLRSLSINNCRGMRSIPDGGFPTSLTSLLVSGMDMCQSLFEWGLPRLVSLRELYISGGRGVRSIPDGGFPTSLTSLSVSGMEICQSLFEWGLHRLVSLRELYISGGQGVMSFPQEEIGMVLPPSLMILSITLFEDLKCLSSIAKYLTCLEKLYLASCPMLEFFPKNGLPASLKELKIVDCPLLQKRFKNHKEGWMIAHIPKVEL